MLQLHTFGGLALEDSGRSVTGAGAQRSRLVLLAVLAASGNRGISRDSLLALLWPENDTESARGALKQALYALRRDLGDSELITGTTDLKLNRSVIDSDVGGFHTALDIGDLERAVGLYRGRFLEGIHLASVEFEEWLSQQRSQLAEEHRQALERLAHAAECRGDYSAAVRWWKGLAAADPLSAAVTRSLMQALVRMGDSAAALRHAQTYEQVVRAQLETAPDRSVLELVESIRRAPRFRQASATNNQSTRVSQEISEAAAPAPETTQVDKASRHLRALVPRHRLIWIGSGAAVTAVIIGTVSLRGGSPALDPDAVVFTESGAASHRTSADSLVMMNLAAGLAQRDSTLTVSLGQLTLVSAGNPALVARHQNRARYEVTVRSSIKADSIQLTAEVTDAATGVPLEPIEPVQVAVRDRDAGIKSMRDRIAIALESRRNPIFESWAHFAAMPRNWEGFEQLELGIRALARHRQEDPDADSYFQAAASLDSSSATPLVWKALLWTQRGQGQVHADSVVADLERFHRRMGPWDRALLAVVKARNRGDKAGSHAAGHELLDLVGYRSEWSFVLAWDLVGLSRYREALELLKRVPDLRWARGWGPAVVARDLAHHNLGDYVGELKAARAELARDPDNRFYIQMEVKALGALGRIREIKQRFERAFTLNPGGYSWQPFEQAVIELQAHGHLDGARTLGMRWIQANEAGVSQTTEEKAFDRAGMYEDMLDWTSAERELRPLAATHPEYGDYLGTLALIQAWRGDRSGLAQTERQIQDLRKGASPSPWEQAQYAALLGDRARAVDLLATAFREGSPARYTLHWEPAFATLRGYAPFEALYKPVEDPAHLREVLRH